jgi:hypothetical protein
MSGVECDLEIDSLSDLTRRMSFRLKFHFRRNNLNIRTLTMVFVEVSRAMNVWLNAPTALGLGGEALARHRIPSSPDSNAPRKPRILS